jgi:hypothetical protein
VEVGESRPEVMETASFFREVPDCVNDRRVASIPVELDGAARATLLERVQCQVDRQFKTDLFVSTMQFRDDRVATGGGDFNDRSV